MKKDQPYHDQSMFKGAPAENFSKAESLRKRMTKAEEVLWERLKNKQFRGLKFRRQHPVQNFIVDFYCHKFKLVVEIDGGYHEDVKQKELDIERSKILEFQGLEVLRFTNEEVLKDIGSVLGTIEERIVL